MMTARDIQMCVADCLQDDEIESLDLILHAMNDEASASWSVARGTPFTVAEVRNALQQLMAAGLVTPCAEQPPMDGCGPIHVDQVGTAFPWEAVWFHLEPAGRDVMRRWWETEGRAKYPLRT